ncbi:MAG: hypothetical protein HC906_07065 [Bacteroidales bacterium]|nr:hypothetical protein [Bacteroidales bacterium]
MIIDYAVSPDFSSGGPSFWEERYGSKPDFTFNMPWRYSGSRGLGGNDDDLQSKQTYDIFVSKQNMKAGDTTHVYAKIQNYSNVDELSDIVVRFYLGDPDNGGELIVNTDGQSEVTLDQINAREPVMAMLNNWVVPASITDQSTIFAVIDPGNFVEEIKEDNNKAWGIVKQGSSVTGIEDFYTKPQIIKRSLVNVHPNPAKNIAEFSFHLLKPSWVTIKLFNMNGRYIKTLEHKN